jgi:hypothetical protein
MSWIEQKSVTRIFNTFKRLKTQVFKEDIDALKTISEALNEKHKTNVKDNLLFAKLLALQLCQNLNHYKDMKIALKVLNNDIQKPLNYHLQFLTTYLNTSELNKFLISVGLDKDWKTQEELDDQKAKIKEHQKEFVEKLQKSWIYDEVEKSFYNTANGILKDVENYK